MSQAPQPKQVAKAVTRSLGAPKEGTPTPTAPKSSSTAASGSTERSVTTGKQLLKLSLSSDAPEPRASGGACVNGTATGSLPDKAKAEDSAERDASATAEGKEERRRAALKAFEGEEWVKELAKQGETEKPTIHLIVVRDEAQADSPQRVRFTN